MYFELDQILVDLWQGVMSLIKGNMDLQSKHAGLLMLQAVVEEFNTSTATPLGLSVDYHKQCCSTFQVIVVKLTSKVKSTGFYF